MKRRGLFAALLGALLPAAYAERRRVRVADYVRPGVSDSEAFEAALAQAHRFEAVSSNGCYVEIARDRDWDLTGLRRPIIMGNTYSGRPSVRLVGP